MHSILYFIFMVCSSVLISGCSFTSQSRSISPYFDGQLKFNNEAIRNAEIILSTKSGDKYCLHAKQTTFTDEQGNFNLKPAVETYTYTPFADQQLDEWTVCAKYNTNTYTLYTNNHYGSGSISGSINLQCNLAKNSSDKFCNTSH